MKSLSSFARLVGGTPNTKRTDADMSVDSLQLYLQSLEPILGSMHTMVADLQGAELATAQSLSEFGSAYGMLGAAERRSLGKSLQAVGHSARLSAAALGSSAYSATAMLGEDIADAQRMVLATGAVFTARKEQRIHHAHALHDLQKAKAELSRVGGATAGEAGATAAAEAQAAETASRECEGSLHSMTLQLADSMQAFRERHLAEFLAAWGRLCIAQARRAALEAELWEGMAGTAEEAAAVEASAAPYLALSPPAVSVGAHGGDEGSGVTPTGSGSATPTDEQPATAQETAFEGDGGDEEGQFV
jgi:hypothetical protein